MARLKSLAMDAVVARAVHPGARYPNPQSLRSVGELVINGVSAHKAQRCIARMINRSRSPRISAGFLAVASCNSGKSARPVPQRRPSVVDEAHDDDWPGREAADSLSRVSPPERGGQGGEARGLRGFGPGPVRTPCATPSRASWRDHVCWLVRDEPNHSADQFRKTASEHRSSFPPRRPLAHHARS